MQTRLCWLSPAPKLAMVPGSGRKRPMSGAGQSSQPIAFACKPEYVVVAVRELFYSRFLLHQSLTQSSKPPKSACVCGRDAAGYRRQKSLVESCSSPVLGGALMTLLFHYHAGQGIRAFEVRLEFRTDERMPVSSSVSLSLKRSSNGDQMPFSIH